MNKTALVVDDSYTMRNMVTIALQDAEFDVISASDGQEALVCAENSEFDVVITDINMPNMDGIELIVKLRDMEQYKYIPILVLTTEGGDNMKSRGKEVGATGWIVKPFNPKTLRNAVERVCPQG